MKRYLFIIGIIAVVFSSCTDKIDLTLPDPEPVLVVDGFITDRDTTQWIKLSSLENYFADPPPNFSVYKNAVVKLLEDGQEVGQYTFMDSTAQFELEYKGINGKWYQIEILLPDGKRYKSEEEFMETVPKIDTIWSVANLNNPDASAFSADYGVYMNTQETPGIGDYYQWKSYVNGEYQAEPQDLNFTNDQFVDGQYVENFEVFGLSEEDYQEFKANSIDGKVWIKVEQTQISSRYYDFLFLVFQQTLLIGGPFAAPPAEIRGNVYLEGGNEEFALGYFYAASVDTKTVLIVE